MRGLWEVVILTFTTGAMFGAFGIVLLLNELGAL